MCKTHQRKTLKHLERGTNENNQITPLIFSDIEQANTIKMSVHFK